MPEAKPLTVRPSTVYISPSIYTSSPTSFTRPTPDLTHEVSKPALSSTSRLQSSDLTRPSTIYTSANIDQSFKAVRRQRTRKPTPSRRGSRNVLNQTLDNFYNILRRTKTDQTVKSARTWANEYENYRKSVIYEEKEYEKYRSSMMMVDDDDDIYGNRRNECERCGSRVYDNSSYRNSTYDHSYSHKNSMYDRSSSYLRGTSSGVTEKRANGVSPINGRRQLSKSSVGIVEHKANEPLYSNYF